MKTAQVINPGEGFPEFHVGDRIRKARESRGISQAELAAAVECSDRTLSRYEAGATPKPYILRRIALATGYTVNQLTGRDDDRDPIEAMLDRRGTVDLRDSQSTCIAPVVTFPQVQSRPADTRVPAAA
jgi:transcriptional regulator with XRE-family HTH domain